MLFTLHRILLGWAGHVAHMGEKRNAYRVVVGETALEGLGVD
jgi:hypothetical protein